jgi:putative transposase
LRDCYREALSVAIIHRKVCELAQQHDLKPPSYGLVYDIVRQLPTALTTLAHDGAKAYKQRFDLLHRREAQAPNEIWQADHCWLSNSRKTTKPSKHRDILVAFS